jgi:phage shock protein PspC (stress-responsive transcriptional regulator)
MPERDDDLPAGRPEPDEPTSETPAGRPEPDEPTSKTPGGRPDEPTSETPGAARDPEPRPGDATAATPHQPASGGPPGGDPPGGVPPTDVPDGGAAEPDRPRRLYRSRSDRMLAGVCGGLAEYFGIDAVIVRVIAVALIFAGGAGALLYVAAWLLVPEDGHEGDEPARGRVATAAGVVALVVAFCILVPFWGGPFGDGGFGGPFIGLAFLGLAGLVVWRLASGQRDAGSSQDLLRRAGLGVALLALSGLLAIGGAWATAAGGGTVVAIIVIVAGLWLVAGAFLGGGTRWLILPALALALPAGVVSAANIDTDGGIGEREYRPVAAQDVREQYRVGMGRLVVDLRDAQLPSGDHRVRIDVGMGEAWVVVPPDVCVSSRADIGAGEVVAFDREVGGVDVDWEDSRRAPAGTARLVLDGDIGLGALHVSHQDPDTHDRGFGRELRAPGNEACIGGARG